MCRGMLLGLLVLGMVAGMAGVAVGAPPHKFTLVGRPEGPVPNAEGRLSITAQSPKDQFCKLTMRISGLVPHSCYFVFFCRQEGEIDICIYDFAFVPNFGGEDIFETWSHSPASLLDATKIEIWDNRPEYGGAIVMKSQ